ncbi:hypothetical protein BJ508DRAFT_312902 [Ascobolus immersus RN42]|uniref:Uncharacterized protein n=1 Tax=Ascobolus immersus RN42 TaxID=1160509 RepID=A0A3N4HXI2_ASCIM|nr:hypothetical protein BJ508DRAFT_312902 [Ascobolus immersus RN42]
MGRTKSGVWVGACVWVKRLQALLCRCLSVDAADGRVARGRERKRVTKAMSESVGAFLEKGHCCIAFTLSKTSYQYEPPTKKSFRWRMGMGKWACNERERADVGAGQGVQGCSCFKATATNKKVPGPHCRCLFLGACLKEREESRDFKPPMPQIQQCGRNETNQREEQTKRGGEGEEGKYNLSKTRKGAKQCTLEAFHLASAKVQ